MRLNFRKITAIAASALMVGLTLGGAVASNYPLPFVSGAGSDVAIVYGSGSGVSSLDFFQAGYIMSNLQSYMSSSGGSSATSVSGGDSIVLATPIRKLYYGDVFALPIPFLTYSELSSILASGTVTDLSGNTYGYSQTVKIGSAAVAYGNSGGDLSDPTLYIDAVTPTTLYNYTLLFTKNLNVSDSTNVQGQKIKILGVDYVIGASSTNSTLYLYGSGTTTTVAGGENQSVNVGGTLHTVELVTTTVSTSTAKIKVDGVSKYVAKGINYAFAGGINVYVKDITYPAYESDRREVELIVGASSLKLENGKPVKKGADESSVQGTTANIKAENVGVISGFTVQIAAPKSQNDSIALGQSFTDPVFGGLKLTFANAVPTLDSAGRGRIVVDAGTSGTVIASVTFTSAKAGSAGEKKLQYVYDNDTTTVLVKPLLAWSNQPSSANGQGIIHVLEGENSKLNDWIVVNSGDFGTVLLVESLDGTSDAATGKVSFRDVITGEKQDFTLTNGTAGYTASGTISGGYGYTITAGYAWNYVNITWNTAGTKALFPRIKLANGGWMAFLTSTTVVNGTTVILPDGLTTLAVGGTLLTNSTNSYVPNGITWSVASGLNAGSTVNLTVNGIASPTCNFNITSGPAILYVEPMKYADTTYGNFICVPLTTTGTTNTEMYMGDPVFNGTSSIPFISYGSDQYKKAAMDKYGVFVTKETRTGTNGVITLSTPSSQIYFDAIFSAVGASITAGTTTVAGAQLGEVLVKDTEVSSVSSKNLVIVGGSCINSAAANVLGGAGCGADFTTKTGIGSNQFLIQSLASPYSSGKVALVVAGYEAADTVNAATYLRTKTVDTAVGKKYQGTNAQTATLVVA